MKVNTPPIPAYAWEWMVCVGYWPKWRLASKDGNAPHPQRFIITFLQNWFDIGKSPGPTLIFQQGVLGYIQTLKKTEEANIWAMACEVAQNWGGGISQTSFSWILIKVGVQPKNMRRRLSPLCSYGRGSLVPRVSAASQNGSTHLR